MAAKKKAKTIKRSTAPKSVKAKTKRKSAAKSK